MGTLIFGGLSWNPAISGILTVVVGVVIILGSVYLIVATNTGARLGMLISLAGFFGWMSILTLYWWITPPGIGPSGQNPSWKPIEVYIHDASSGPALTEVVNSLPDPKSLPSAAEVVEAHPDGIANQVVGKPENAILPDVLAIKNGDTKTGADVLKQYYGIDSTQFSQVTGEDKLGDPNKLDWKLITPSEAGEASAAADAALIDAGLFQDATEYKKINYYETGGSQTRAEACPEGEGEAKGNLLPPEAICRALFRIKRTFTLWHPSRYQVVQVQPVIEQETKPGEAPPLPIVDETKPAVSVVLLRDQGNVRAKPAYFFAICFSLFIVFVLILHYRDKTLMQHLEEAEKAKAEAKAKG